MDIIVIVYSTGLMLTALGLAMMGDTSDGIGYYHNIGLAITWPFLAINLIGIALVHFFMKVTKWKYQNKRF